MLTGRREFIKNISLGMAGFSFGSTGLTPLAGASSPALSESRVSLTAGNDRRDIENKNRLPRT